MRNYPKIYPTVIAHGLTVGIPKARMVCCFCNCFCDQIALPWSDHEVYCVVASGVGGDGLRKKKLIIKNPNVKLSCERS